MKTIVRKEGREERKRRDKEGREEGRIELTATTLFRTGCTDPSCCQLHPRYTLVLGDNPGTSCLPVDDVWVPLKKMRVQEKTKPHAPGCSPVGRLPDERVMAKVCSEPECPMATDQNDLESCWEAVLLSREDEADTYCTWTS